LRVKVQPRARRDEVDELHADRLRVRVAAAPAGGKANQSLLRLLALEFAVPVSRVRLASGAHTSMKTVEIDHPQVLPAWFQDLAKSH
jgi:hypothetical protein